MTHRIIKITVTPHNSSIHSTGHYIANSVWTGQHCPTIRGPRSPVYAFTSDKRNRYQTFRNVHNVSDYHGRTCRCRNPFLRVHCSEQSRNWVSDICIG